MPWSWKETSVADGLGEYYVSSLWSQPLHTAFDLLVFFNISFEVQTKILGLLVIILGFWTTWKLLEYYSLTDRAKSVGSTFFILNTYFLLLFDGGQLSLALAYSCLPACTYFFFKSLKRDYLKDRLLFALSALLISIFDIRIVYLIFLLITMYMIFELFFSFRQKGMLFIKTFKLGFLTVVVLLSFHLFWLLPSFISKSIQLPQTYGRISQTSFLSFSSLLHAIFLQQPHWYENVFGRVSKPSPEFILIPVLVFVLTYLKKNKVIGFWLIIALVGVFLTKGSNEPLSFVYPLLFNYLPGFILFRDPSKFYFLVCLATSVLIAFSTQNLLEIKARSPFLNKLLKFTPLLIIMYLVFLVRPLYLKQMNGLFAVPPLQTEFEVISKILSEDSNFSRVLWIPATPPLGYRSTTHPPAGSGRLIEKRPIAIGAKGTYETFNFLREAPYMSEIFDVASIGYIAYTPLDSRKDDMSQDNLNYYTLFSNQLAKLPWLERIASSRIPLFKVKNHQDKFFIAQNIWWVLGADDIYNESTRSSNLKLSNNALIFPEQNVELGKKIDNIKNIKLVLNKKNVVDLAANFIDPINLIVPSKQLDFSPNKTGWWKREAIDLISWRDFLQTKYGIDNQDFDLGGGWSVGEGNRRLTIQDPAVKPGGILLARVMESSRSGNLKFYQENQLVGQLDTKKEGNNIRWFEVGNLKSKNPITIESEGDINVVNMLAVLDQLAWDQKVSKAKKIEADYLTDFAKINPPKQDIKVSYKQINPTKYIVQVSGVSSEVMLVFSENFDNLWQINGKSASLPVYSMLNGFLIDKDGEYIIEFGAQKYVHLGLILSFISIFFVAIILIHKINKKRI